MALKIQIKPGRKMVINGAVLENGGKRVVSLLVRNQVAILRERDVLPPEEAATPATRTYYALQCAYIFPFERERHLAHFNDFLAAFLKAVPSALPIGEDIREAARAGDLFKALKTARALIAHEGEILRHAEQDAKQIQHASRAGESGEE